jgi:hypothetical protein
VNVVRSYTAGRGESYVEVKQRASLPFTERDGTRAPLVEAVDARVRVPGPGFSDGHPAPPRLYSVYLTARVDRNGCRVPRSQPVGPPVPTLSV